MELSVSQCPVFGLSTTILAPFPKFTGTESEERQEPPPALPSPAVEMGRDLVVCSIVMQEAGRAQGEVTRGPGQGQRGGRMNTEKPREVQTAGRVTIEANQGSL